MPKNEKREVITMHATYGSKKCGGKSVPLSPCGSVNAKPPEPDRIESDRFPRCRGCPYPRHGMFCWTDSESCLRTEMEGIYNRGRRMGAVAI